MMTIAVLLGIGLNAIILVLRGYVLQICFGELRARSKIFIASVLAGGYLALLPRLAKHIPRPVLDYMDATQYTHRSFFLILAGAIVLLGVVLSLLFRSRPAKQLSIVHLLFAILVVISGRWGISALSMSIVTRVLVALCEERVKSSATLTVWNKYGLLSSDLILFGICAALGFAFAENIVYLGHLSDATTQLTTGLVLKRALTSRVMHITYTGIIAIAITMRGFSRKKIPRLIGGILLGTGTHLLYNVFLLQANALGICAVLVVGYFFISRLLYRSERVYIG